MGAGGGSLRMQVRVVGDYGRMVFLNNLDVGVHETSADVKYTCNLVQREAASQQLQDVLVDLNVALHRA
jgi:hypothetical protein